MVQTEPAMGAERAKRERVRNLEPKDQGQTGDQETGVARGAGLYRRKVGARDSAQFLCSRV